jgi:hypothetical protein
MKSKNLLRVTTLAAAAAMFAASPQSSMAAPGPTNVAFDKSTPFEGAGNPRGVGIVLYADYDGDDKLDAFMGGYGCFKLYKGAGNGTFTDATAAFPADDPFRTENMLWKGGALWVDYNADGAVDLIAAGYYSGGAAPVTRVYKNSGAPNYLLEYDAAASASLPQMTTDDEEASGRWIAAAESTDGILLAMCNKDITTDGAVFKIFSYNSVSGEFGLYFDAAPLFLNRIPTRGALAWADYDNDGKPDLLFSGDDNPEQNSSGVLHNGGDGTFTAVLFNHTACHADAVWIDYDGDGKLDAFVAGTYWAGDWQWWNGWLYKNNGDGTFTEVTTGNPFGATTNGSIAVGDLNGDGLPDLLMTGQVQGGGPIHYNNGDGTFTRNSTTLASHSIGVVQKGMVTFADVNGDDKLDITIVGVYGDNFTPTLLINRYPNTDDFTLPELPTAVPVENKAVFAESALSSMAGNVSKGGGAVWGDYDNDGKLDVFIWGISGSDQAPTAKLYKNNGDGTFTDVTTTMLGPSFSGFFKGSALWVDVNNDEYLDLVVAGGTQKIGDGTAGGLIFKVYINDGIVGGTFMEDQTIQSAFTAMHIEKDGGCAYNLAAADYNNDGWQDILVSGQAANGETNADGSPGTDRIMAIYKNMAGAGFMQETGTNIVAHNGGGIMWGDYDKDGDMDLVFTGYRDGSGWRSGVLTNNGDGTFAETMLKLNDADWANEDQQIREYGTEQGDAIWVDVDGDGYLDVVLTGAVASMGYEFNGALNKYNPWRTEGWIWGCNIVFKYNPDTRTFGYGLPPHTETLLGASNNQTITSADLNDDDRSDIVVFGQDWGGGGSNRGVYYSDGNGRYDYAALPVADQLNSGTTSIVDVNNDGKMDIFVTGNREWLPKLYMNTSSAAPAVPAVPTGLSMTQSDDGTLTLTWNANAKTSDRYNVYLSTPSAIYGDDVISILPVDRTTGALRVALDHKAPLTGTTYKLKGLRGGTYKAAVQAVGINGRYSAFSAEQQTTVSGGQTAVRGDALQGTFIARRSGDAIVATIDLASEAELEVYNVQGTKLFSRQGVQHGDVEITGLAKDNIYFVVVRSGSRMEARKVLY